MGRMMQLASTYSEIDTVFVPPKPKPQLVRLTEAAEAFGLHPQTVRNYLTRGFLTRYKNKEGAPRATYVDMNELRELRENPPAEPR